MISQQIQGVAGYCVPDVYLRLPRLSHISILQNTLRVTLSYCADVRVFVCVDSLVPLIGEEQFQVNKLCLLESCGVCWRCRIPHHC